MQDHISFKNCYTVGRKTYKEWEKLHVLRGKKEIFFQILWVLFSLTAVLWGIYILKQGVGFPWVPAGIIIFCFFRGVVVPPMRAKAWQEMMIRNAGKEQWERTILFGKEITMKENQKQSDFSYDQIERVKEYDCWYAIIMKTRGVLYVAKKGFTFGNKDKFLKWLEEKRIEAEKSIVEESEEIL